MSGGDDFFAAAARRWTGQVLIGESSRKQNYVKVDGRLELLPPPPDLVAAPDDAWSATGAARAASRRGGPARGPPLRRGGIATPSRRRTVDRGPRIATQAPPGADYRLLPSPTARPLRSHPMLERGRGVLYSISWRRRRARIGRRASTEGAERVRMAPRRDKIFTIDACPVSQLLHVQQARSRSRSGDERGAGAPFLPAPRRSSRANCARGPAHPRRRASTSRGVVARIDVVLSPVVEKYAVSSTAPWSNAGASGSRPAQ